jgi:hypothetical protein
MSVKLELKEITDGVFAIGRVGGGELWRYTTCSRAPANEAPRPYAHPMYSIDGDVLTNFRPNDHPWHHALSMTLASVDGVNFWGGPSHRAADSYLWRGDHGCQRHVSWAIKTPELLEESLRWIDPQQDDRVLLEETRVLETILQENGWTLRWTSRLRNPGANDLICHNYHSLGGLVGSHYTGLQFRGARGLLDQHGDATIGFRNEAGETKIDAVHGIEGNWVEWSTQHDGSLRRTKVRFESLSGALPWFVRPQDPMVAFPPHREAPWVISAGESVELSHALNFDRL